MITATTITDKQIRAMRYMAERTDDGATVITCDVALGYGIETTHANVAAAKECLVPIWNEPTQANLTPLHIDELAKYPLDANTGTRVARVVEMARDARSEWRGTMRAARAQLAEWYRGLTIIAKECPETAGVFAIFRKDEEGNKR